MKVSKKTLSRGLLIMYVSQDRDLVILIIPANEKDQKAEEGIQQYVRKIKEMLKILSV